MPFSNFEIGPSSKPPTMTWPTMRFCFRVARAFAMAMLLSRAGESRAGTLQTLDGKRLDGELRFADSDAVQVQPREGAAIVIPLTNVLRARFSSGPFLSGGSVLPNGWFLQAL